MASNSHRKSGSSGRSEQRKRVHLGTGTASRKASAHPEVHVEGKGSTSPRTRGTTQSRSRAASAKPRRERQHPAPQRPLSAKQAERLRRRAVQRRAMLVRAVAVVAAAAALWALWLGISSSQVFAVREIDVIGNTQLTEEQVVEAAGIPSTVTILRLDTDDVESRLLANPWIEDVRVSRRIPGTVRIEVQERAPIAMVDTGLTFWFVDQEFRVIAETVPATDTVAPVIRDVPDFVAEPGTVSDSDALRNAVQTLRGLDPELVGSVRIVSAPAVNETALLTAGSVEIMIGQATRLDEKSAVVMNILRERGDQVVFIDVRTVERPISRGLSQ